MIARTPSSEDYLAVQELDKQHNDDDEVEVGSQSDNDVPHPPHSALGMSLPATPQGRHYAPTSSNNSNVNNNNNISLKLQVDFFSFG